MSGLNDEVYRTIHRSCKAVEGIALETGIKTGTLYRYGLAPETSGLDIPMRKLVPIMRASGHFGILRVMAAACGFLLVKLPRVARNRDDESELVGVYQRVCHVAVEKLLQFFDLPNLQNCGVASDALKSVAECSYGIDKRIRRHFQTELDFE